MAEDFQSKAADMMKKVLTIGVGTIFLTEESLRGLISEFKLPKELIGGILESAGKSKNDFLQKLSSELLDRVQEKVDVHKLVQEILQKNELQFEVKLKFMPKSDSKHTHSAE